MTPEDDWRQHAACRGMNADLFYPPRGGDTRLAKAVCATCPVRQQCLDDAMTEEATTRTVGVRGGMSGKQRRRLRTQRNAA